ncbi:MAG: sulfate reduction electron transfer complex DsrMKJOP subunit DsrJ [Thermodesulfobacteriota bacterium]|nr:sulfate reduction electron transfer complex DsrMKJOP subunit DsrJ [Thermodesulfobacteriota bacterium]
MNNKGLIITGLIIFFVIVTIPFWYNLGADAEVPEPELTEKAKAAEKCVESTEFMKTEHMQILDLWRESVVRDAKRTYINSNGKAFDMSLTNTCLDCHSNKEKFCDRCHNYASVRPYCWDCHNTKESE